MRSQHVLIGDIYFIIMRLTLLYFNETG